MSYARKKELSGNRSLAIFFTVAIVGSLMYAIVTGLAYNVIKKSVEDLKTFDVEEQPPPPEEPPPPPKDMPKVPPPPTIPPPLVRMEAPPPPIAVVEAPHPPPIPPVAIAPPPPPLPPRKVVSAQSAKGDLRSLFSADDYPASAQSSGAEGTVRASLTIGPDGRVTGCNITQSSGNGALDSATCNILRRRAKFVPARDSNGNPTSDTIATPSIIWRLEG
jgi:protein TonB